MSENANVVALPTGKRFPEARAGGISLGAAVDAGRFKLGMRRLAAGVSIIATTLEEVRYGLVATAVNSVSADPPTLLVCVSQTASAHDFISRAGRFSVNVLHADDRELAENFSRPEFRTRRFSFGEWSTATTGAPVLDSALVAFDCLIAQEARVASHTVFFGQVVDVRLSDGPIDPLLFWNSSYHTAEAGPR
ncbi:flavin reductase [Pseudochelatococcus lubricantis]|uniref:Flavin reductase n=1 Tax=Pseudochelatococcus lubricantis TaxID=1538102 RepID=A0ABX0V2F5_9HYPH|nr:flavin reductase [Pseudochelatococcus lubricantis]